MEIAWTSTRSKEENTSYLLPILPTCLLAYLLSYSSCLVYTTILRPSVRVTQISITWKVSY
jgi:hypothetical protein